jgi:glycosyltransferase involved in cell wall biosynthesis
MVRLARRQPVLFVETGDFLGKRVMAALRRGGLCDLFRVRRSSPGVTVMTAWNIVPFRQRSAVAMRWNALLNRPRIRRAARHTGRGVAVAWLYDVTALDLATTLRPRLRVYHCVDDYAGYVTHPARVALLERAERAACRWADGVFTTSQPLADRLSGMGTTAVALGNVADFEHFSSADGAAETPELEALPRPRLLFCGSFTRRKVDVGALTELARRMPGAAVVLVGPVTDADEEFRRAFAHLASHPNVHYLGPRTYDELPILYRSCDLGLIPYVRNRYTTGVFPMKVFEYLAAGLPVVALGLSSLDEVGSPVTSTTSLEAFLDAVQQETERSRDPGDGRALARANTWDTRLARMESEIASLQALQESPLTHRGANGQR